MTPKDAVAGLRDDQATRWRRGDRVPAEHYLQVHPKLTDEDRLVLVAGELALRWELGERPTVEEYADRFPEFASDLLMQFELRSLVDGTAPFAPTPTGPVSHDDSSPRPEVPGYELHDEIGRGGWAVVYRAMHTRLGRPVAVKVIHGGLTADPARAVRAMDEARVLAKLNHPNVLQVYEVGQTAGGLFLTLELADAGTLADQLQTGPLPPNEAAALLVGVAAAAAAAHACGVVHRDIKPSNILLVADTSQRTADTEPAAVRFAVRSSLSVKLADFGLAKQLDLGPGVTTTGQVLGTPRYMAPEQAAGDNTVGPAADVYAIGAVLYECLTGRPPLLGAGTLALLRQVQEQVPVNPRTLNPAVPVDLATVTMKCLEKEPGRRYPTAAELENDLRRFRAGEPVTARPVGTVERSWRWARRHPREARLVGLAAGLLLILAAGSVGAAVLLKRQRDVAVAAERDTELARLDAERLIAHQLRETGRLGQRAAGLEAVRKRWDATPSIGRTSELRLALRSEATAALTATDFEKQAVWPVVNRWYGDTDAPRDHPDRLAAADPVTGETVIVGDPPIRLGPPVGDYRLRRFSPDGRRLVEGCFVVGRPDITRLRVWDTSTGKLLVNRQLSIEWWTWLEFLPDGRLLVTESESGQVVVLDTDSGVEVGRSPRGLRPHAVAGHPDRRRVAIASQRTQVRVLDLADGWREVARPLLDDSDTVSWSPDGRLLGAISPDGNIGLWDSDTGVVRTAPGPHQVGPRLVMFTSPSTLVTSSDDGVTVVWDVPTLRPLVRLPGRLVQSFGADRLMLADEHQTILYARSGRGEYRELPPANAVVPSPDGALLITSDPGGPTVRASGTLRPLAKLALDVCGPVGFDPAGDRMATFGQFSKVWVWPVANPGGGRRILGPPAQISYIAPVRRGVIDLPQHEGLIATWAGGRLFATDHRDGRLLVLDPAGRPAQVVGQQVSPMSLAGSPDGRWVAAAASVHQHLRVYSVGGSVLLDRPWFAAVSFSPNGQLLAAVGRAGLAVYRVGAWDRPIWEVGSTGLTDWAGTAVAFRPDSRVVAVPISRNQVGLFDTDTGKRLLDLPLTGPAEVLHLAFAPDGGQLYVSRRDSAAGVWNLRVIADELAGLGLSHPLDSLPPPVPIPDVTTVTVDRRPSRGELPTDLWASRWRWMAVGEELKGLWSDAAHNITVALNALPVGPEHIVGRADLLAIRGSYHLRGGSSSAARSDWQMALRLNPNRVDVADRLAGLFLADGDPTSAAAELAMVPPARRDSRWRSIMARADAARCGTAAVAGGLAGR